MFQTTFDPTMQLARQPVRPWTTGQQSAGIFSAGGGLLPSQFDISNADVRTFWSEASRALAARQQGGFVQHLDLTQEHVLKFEDSELLQRLLPFREKSGLGLANAGDQNNLDRDVLPFLMAVRRCIEADQLSAAREMIGAASAHVLNNPLVIRLRSLLAPPIVKRVEKQDVDRSLEYKWLRAESQKHRGQWVALQGEHLVAIAPTLRELRETLRAQPLIKAPLIHRIE